ncbi:hypothetical protein P3T39_005381 [Kitasatospora sp. GP82]|nr:hypothetical protein [Kitasatospora sp. GP82]
MTATSADGCCTKWRVVAVIGQAGGLGGIAEGVAEEVYSVALEAEPDVGIHRRGDADVGVSEEFLLMTTSSTPCSRRRVAVEWRRSWKRI